MPRDLEYDRQVEEEGFPALQKEDELHNHSYEDQDIDDADVRIPGFLGRAMSMVEHPNFEKVKHLHPYAQILGHGDLESCMALEEAVFPPAQACSREKFQYRLSKCSELCYGLFSSATSTDPESDEHKAQTAATANAPDSFEPARKGILLSHLIATKTTNETITDDDMELPTDWQDNTAKPSAVGHKEEGRTLAVHSLAVLPDYQGRGLGTMLMKSYVQRMVEADIADRIALLTYERLVPYYESLGFDHIGISEAKYGGEEWHDMVLEFSQIRLGPRYEDD